MVIRTDLFINVFLTLDLIQQRQQEDWQTHLTVIHRSSFRGVPLVRRVTLSPGPLSSGRSNRDLPLVTAKGCTGQGCTGSFLVRRGPEGQQGWSSNGKAEVGSRRIAWPLATHPTPCATPSTGLHEWPLAYCWRL